MTTLNEQIDLLSGQLQLSQQADDARHILQECNLIHTPLFSVDESLKTVCKRFRVLQALPDDAPQKMEFSDDVLEVAKNALFALQKFAARWGKEGYEARQGDDLALTTDILEAFVRAGSGEEDKCWQDWLDSLERLVALEDVRLRSQKNIPGMEKIHDDFVQTRTKFRELVAEFPEDSNDIERLQQISVTMQELRNKMRFDLPEEVATFFKELDSVSRRVSLAKMTAEVFEWLRSNDLLDDYVVSPRGTVRGY